MENEREINIARKSETGNIIGDIFLITEKGKYDNGYDKRKERGIKQIYDLIQTNNCVFNLDEGSFDALNKYMAYVDGKREIWNSKRNDKKLRIRALEREFFSYKAFLNKTNIEDTEG